MEGAAEHGNRLASALCGGGNSGTAGPSAIGQTAALYRGVSQASAGHAGRTAAEGTSGMGWAGTSETFENIGAFCIARRFARSRTVPQSRYSLRRKAPTPIDHRVRPHLPTPGHRADRLPCQTSQNDSRSFHQSRFYRAAARPIFQNLAILLRTFRYRRCFWQRHPLPITLRNIHH